MFFPLPAQSHHMLSMGHSASPTAWRKNWPHTPGMLLKVVWVQMVQCGLNKIRNGSYTKCLAIGIHLETRTNNETVRTPRSVSECFLYVLSSLCMFFFMVCLGVCCLFFPLPVQSHHMLSMGPSASPTVWRTKMAAHPGNAFEGNMGPDGPMWAEQNPKWIVHQMSSYWNHVGNSHKQ